MRYHTEKRPETDDGRELSGLSDRAREAERILSRSLAAAREEAPQTATPLTVVRAVVEARARSAAKENSLMSAIKRPFSMHPRLSLAVALGVLVFAFATLVPMEYQRTTGYEINLAGIDPAVGLNAELLEDMLSALGYEDTEFDIHSVSDELRCRVRDLPSRYAAREVAAAIASVTGFDGKPEITEQVETVSGSLYAQVKCELRDLDDFDFEGKTEEEIKTEIEERLAAQGFYDAKVEVRTLENFGDEKREILIKIKKGPDSGDDFDCSGLYLEGLDLDDESKSDIELEEEIEQRLADAGKPGVEVSVTTRADGKRRIEIKCKPD
jgi:hypothetical protein